MDVQIGLVNRILSVLTSDAPDEAQEKDAIALLQASLDPGALLQAGRLDDFESALRCAPACAVARPEIPPE